MTDSTPTPHSSDHQSGTAAGRRGLSKPVAALLLLVSAVALAAAAWLIAGKLKMPAAVDIQPPEQYWVYDLEHGTLQVMGTEQYPPFTLENGATGYWATVYSCSDCADAGTHKVAMLTKFSDAAKAVHERGPTPSDTELITSDDAEMVATVEMARRGEWLDSASGHARLLMEAMAGCETAEVCRP